MFPAPRDRRVRLSGWRFAYRLLGAIFGILGVALLAASVLLFAAAAGTVVAHGWGGTASRPSLWATTGFGAACAPFAVAALAIAGGRLFLPLPGEERDGLRGRPAPAGRRR